MKNQKSYFHINTIRFLFFMILMGIQLTACTGTDEDIANPATVYFDNVEKVGYTYHQASGNRYLLGQGNSTAYTN